MASGIETTSAHTEVPSTHDSGHGGGNSSAISGSMFFWFLVVFGMAAFILKKYAFGPILDGLDAREAEIEQSLENADRLERELLTLEDTVSTKLDETETQVRDMIDKGRNAAREAGQVIEEKAKEEAQILRENAQRDLESAKGKAESDLRKSSAETAVAMAAKLLDEKLDDKSRKALTDRLIAEV